MHAYHEPITIKGFITLTVFYEILVSAEPTASLYYRHALKRLIGSFACIHKIIEQTVDISQLHDFAGYGLLCKALLQYCSSKLNQKRQAHL